ncbi:MAG TPA: S1/P1 nuclease [Gemmataceae bacterium]|nr:S1/P1 nuclease [Gemmataceae bacterium]
MVRALALGIVLALLTAAPAPAWNRPGHMVTGAIAYQVLKNESEPTIAKVIALLKQHPDFKKWDKQADSRKLAGADRDLYVFMMAARWADDARDNPTFYPPDLHYDRLHYINYPYKPAGEPESVKTTPPGDINIVRGYADKLDVIAGKSADADRAVALCWIFHFVGDVHQPLHAVSRFSARYPKGDRGGSACYIRATEKNAPISLHQFWDDLITGSEGFQTVRNKATELRNRQEFAKDKLTELAVTEFQQWAAKESLELAKKYVYLDGKLEGSPKLGAATALPADYAKTVQPIAERRAVLAGYRLAAVLRKQLD